MIVIVAIMLMTTEIAAQTAGASGTGMYRVPVCIGNNVVPELPQAELIAERMFQAAGVVLEWHRAVDSRGCLAGVVRINVVQDTDSHLNPGALAYAVSNEGNRIQVFYDRIQRFQLVKPSALLGHVLVHEITHILQGVGRHSEAGVMKAKWEAADYDQMPWKWLPFTAADIELIHHGLQNGTARAVWVRAATPAK